MSTARKGLSRIAELYGLVERLRSLELRAAALLVDDAARASALERSLQHEEIARTRGALKVGNREERLVAESAHKAGERRIARLTQLREERQVVWQEAWSVHVASRLDKQQMQSVLERARAEAAIDEGRRMQSASDDRFGSRLGWLRLEQQRRTK